MKKIYLTRLIIAGIILILSVLAVLGVYPVKIMDLQFTPLLKRAISGFALSTLLIFALLIVLTLLFGRFYCSALCPLGIFQEFFALLIKKKGEVQKNLPFKYFISALTFGALIDASALLIRYIDPYTMFASAVSLSAGALIFVFLVLALVSFKNRYFCTNICPVGAVLGLLSKVSMNKIHINKEDCASCGLCAKTCPSGCINPKKNP